MNLELCVKAITDPRNTKNQRYSLESLLLIIFSSVVSGYDSPRSISKFAELKIKWLQKYVPIQSVPCAETIRALLVCIKASDLIDGFKAFAQNISPECNEFDLIALDGKTVRGSRKNGFDAVHVISAWSCKRGITLFAQASEGKKNEITTLPKIIDKLEVSAHPMGSVE